MKIYFADGEDLLHRAGPYQTQIVLADDEAAAREVIKRENPGFRIDRIELIRDYPKLVIARPAVVSKITNSEPMA